MINIEELKNKILVDPEENGDRLFAEYLGITYEELKSIKYQEERVYVEMPNGGKNLASFRIEFKDEPKEVLQKILANNSNPLEVNAEFYISIYDPLPEEVWSFLFEETQEFNDFMAELNSLENFLVKLSGLNLPEEDNQILYRQFYIGTFAALETCLQDTFMKLISTNINYKNDFIRNHPELSKRKISLSEYHEYKTKLDKIVNEIIQGTIYHNFRVVKNMYQDSIGVDFPSISKLYKYLPKRHDLVHRNGKTKSGIKQSITPEEIKNLISDTKIFIIRLLINTNMFQESALVELFQEID